MKQSFLCKENPHDAGGKYMPLKIIRSNNLTNKKHAIPQLFEMKSLTR